MISQYLMPGNNKIVMNGRDDSHKNAPGLNVTRSVPANLKYRFRHFKIWVKEVSSVLRALPDAAGVAPRLTRARA
jgi:hypothetical protein